MGAYMDWEETLKEKARDWLVGNNLDPAAAQYLTNFISLHLDEWKKQKDAAIEKQTREREARERK